MMSDRDIADRWKVAEMCHGLSSAVHDRDTTPDELAAIEAALDEIWGHLNRADARFRKWLADDT